MKSYNLPTGFLFTDDYSKGQLETLSIGDYGKKHNIKADFLGYTKELNGVPNGLPIQPLTEKWVITLSTQFGCAQKCNFCACPKIPFKGNASFDDLKKQLYSAISMFPNVKYTERLNVHFARMGEPIFNNNVWEFSGWMYENKLQIKKDTGLSIETLHPVMTTSVPKKLYNVGERIFQWCYGIKNNCYNGQAGLQLSINSTDDAQRDKMFNGLSHDLKTISQICYALPEPIGRKYCLNFALASDFIVDAKKLANLFDSEIFMVKITPIHNNDQCRQNKIETLGGYNSFEPYRKVEQELKEVGFDVLIFVPSMDEENGLVTCGNAILSGSEIKL